eukprot:TRINITY_DN442_c0_g1_i5.p1 TRINITY_DN442_c0_g1~~TRINITY_DN442_c0_g1_i5.p1  ORF type:complete len:538 (-),score=215.53 TRINITY_DN442_c0_g1_i5:40-1653(-)
MSVREGSLENTNEIENELIEESNGEGEIEGNEYYSQHENQKEESMEEDHHHHHQQEGQEEIYNQDNEENNNYNEEGMEGEGYVDPFVSWGKSIYSYEGSGEGELKFEVGQWIGVLEDYGDGWSLGQVDGQGDQGNFPTDYLDYSAEAQQDAGYATIRKKKKKKKTERESVCQDSQFKFNCLQTNKKEKNSLKSKTKKMSVREGSLENTNEIENELIEESNGEGEIEGNEYYSQKEESMEEDHHHHHQQEGQEEIYNQDNEENNNYNEEGMEGEGYVDPFVSWGKSIYSYEGSGEGELKFEVGQWIGVLEDYGDGWSLGQVDGQGDQGNFPTDYLDYSAEAQQDAGYATIRDAREEQKTEASQKRKDERKQLMGEMKHLQEEAEKQTQLADSLQKEMSDLSELIQKERLLLNEIKSSKLDEQSLVHDVLRLIYSMDHFGDVSHALANSEGKLHESFSNLANDIHKESKSRPALASHASNLGMKIANHQGHTEALSKMLEELVKSSFDVRPQLEVLVGFLTKVNQSTASSSPKEEESKP